MEKKHMQLSVWDNPSNKLQSQYGFITYKEWCEREAARIGADAFLNGSDSLICLCREVQP
jgi:hypothetical protein